MQLLFVMAFLPLMAAHAGSQSVALATDGPYVTLPQTLDVVPTPRPPYPEPAPPPATPAGETKQG